MILTLVLIALNGAFRNIYIVMNNNRNSCSKKQLQSNLQRLFLRCVSYKICVACVCIGECQFIGFVCSINDDRNDVVHL